MIQLTSIIYYNEKYTLNILLRAYHVQYALLNYMYLR